MSKIELDGFVVYLYRGIEGVVTIDIETSDATGNDVLPPHDVPRLRLWVNEECRTINQFGDWEAC